MEEQKNYRKQNVLLAIVGAIGLVLIFQFVTKVMPSSAPVKDHFIGTYTVRGTVISLPEAFGPDPDTLHVFFSVEGYEGVRFRAKIPQRCGDDIAVGTIIQAQVYVWNGVSITDTPPPSQRQRTEEAEVICEKKFSLSREAG